MKRKSLYLQKIESLNVFQAFTDLISNAFMILSLFLVLALFQSLELNRRALELNKRLQAASPLIIDEKSGQFQFKSGSAELTPELQNYILIDVVPKIETIVKEREIDFIQVIGHTDGQEMSYFSNLDKQLENVAQGKESVKKLQAGSNADLALMRALAVVQTLQQTGRLKNVDFRAYSAAQLYLPSGELAPIERQPNQSRRRIEIRFIPPGKQE
jgi:flagellar motor protein MotB